MNEDNRQAVHFAVGVIAILIVAFVGFNTALVIFSALFLIGLCLANYKLLGGKVKFVDEFLQAFDREERIPAAGAMFYAAGILMILTYARSIEFAFAIIALQAAGDAFATVVGSRFERGWNLPWNSEKTYPGMLAFIVTGSAAAWIFLPFQEAVIFGVALAIVETLPINFDDNLSVPMAALVLKRGIGL